MLETIRWKHIFAAIGGGLTIGILASMGDTTSIPLLMAPFGASCVIAFLLPNSPLSKPRSIIGGHVLSSFTGLLLLHTVGTSIWSLALSVGLSILVMQLTKTIHPPAGADPLVVMLSSASWSFLITPVLLGTVLLVIIAFFYHKLVNHMSAKMESTAKK